MPVPIGYVIMTQTSASQPPRSGPSCTCSTRFHNRIYITGNKSQRILLSVFSGFDCDTTATMSMMTWASVNEECETTEIAPETDTVHFTDATVKRVDWSWKTVQAKYLASQYSHRHQQSSSIRSSRELAFPPPTELSVAWPNINPKLNDTTPGSRLASRVSSVIRRAHLAFKSHKLVRLKLMPHVFVPTRRI